MALFDTNSGLGGLLGNLGDYGFGLPSNTGGLVADEDRDAINKRALLSGLISAGLTYAATPKNLNTGSALPYLGRAGLAGFGASQDVIDRSLNTAYRNKILTGKDDNIRTIKQDRFEITQEKQPDGSYKEIARSALDAPREDKSRYTDAYGNIAFTKFGTDNPSALTLEQRMEVDAEVRRRALQKPPKEEDTFKQTNELRSSFQNLPEVKSWNITQPILMSAREASKDTSGASDLNLIYALGKALDPNSVVREGELELAAGTGSLGEKLKGYYKSTTAGGKLTPEVKQDLLRQIESRTYAQKKQYDSAKKQYTSIANKYKLDPGELFIEPIVEPLDTSQPVKRLSTQDQQALDWANANTKDPRAAQIKQRLGL
jgi:hypothetical protein